MHSTLFKDVEKRLHTFLQEKEGTPAEMRSLILGEILVVEAITVFDANAAAAEKPLNIKFEKGSYVGILIQYKNSINQWLNAGLCVLEKSSTPTSWENPGTSDQPLYMNFDLGLAGVSTPQVHQEYVTLSYSALSQPTAPNEAMLDSFYENLKINPYYAGTAQTTQGLGIVASTGASNDHSVYIGRANEKFIGVLIDFR